MNTCHGFFYRECHNLTKQYNMSEIFCLLNCLQLDSVVWRLTLMINFQLTILCKGRLQNPACNVSATDRMNNMHSNLSMGHFRGFPALAQLFYQAWYGFFEIASKFVLKIRNKLFGNYFYPLNYIMLIIISHIFKINIPIT